MIVSSFLARLSFCPSLPISHLVIWRTLTLKSSYIEMQGRQVEISLSLRVAIIRLKWLWGKVHHWGHTHTPSDAQYTNKTDWHPNNAHSSVSHRILWDVVGGPLGGSGGLFHRTDKIKSLHLWRTLCSWRQLCALVHAYIWAIKEMKQKWLPVLNWFIF